MNDDLKIRLEIGHLGDGLEMVVKVIKKKKQERKVGMV